MYNEPEMNFSIQFNLSRSGMIKEIETEFNILRICFTQLSELDEEYSSCIERIMVMPLRKLLCEANSVLLQVCPNFKMPPLQGQWIELEHKLKMVRPPLHFIHPSCWVSLFDWHKTKVAFFDKAISELPEHIPPYVFQVILNKLNKSEKITFQDLFQLEEITINGRSDHSWIRKFPDNNTKNQMIYEYLKKANYYDLSIYNFIKHLSDKRGAHIDIGHGPIIEMVNQKDNNGHNLILCFAIQLIWAAKEQIVELSDYWPEMDTIVREVIE